MTQREIYRMITTCIRNGGEGQIITDHSKLASLLSSLYERVEKLELDTNLLKSVCPSVWYKEVNDGDVVQCEGSTEKLEEKDEDWSQCNDCFDGEHCSKCKCCISSIGAGGGKLVEPIPKLSDLIKTKKFDYVNSDMTDDLFEQPKELGTEFDLVHFDRYISSEDAIKELSKDGWRPATAWDLLNYNWNGKDWIVALGSVRGVLGSRRVPCLYEDDSERRLRLLWWDGGWDACRRFLRVRNSVPEKLVEERQFAVTKEGEVLCERTKIDPKDFTPLEWEKEYCKKFGLCQDGGDKCDCAEEIKFISNLLKEERESIKKDLLAIADKGEIEDLRREVTNYFNKL